MSNARDAPFDLIIAGAGPAGATLAYALAPWLRRIAVIDARPPEPDPARQRDPRTLALAERSAALFAGLGLWRTIAPHATPIRTVHARRPGPGATVTLTANGRRFGALGFTIGGGTLTALLHRALLGRSVTWRAPATIRGVRVDDDSATLDCDDGPVTGRLLAAADGSHSTIRHALGIETARHDYRQSALLAEVTTEPPAADTAYEFFTPGGPLALLPRQGRWSLVWVQPTAEAEALARLSDAAFAGRLQAVLEERLRVTAAAGTRRTWPLLRTEARTLVGERTALVGNAAHTVHPVGAQGLNIGLRDAAALADLVVTAVRAGADPGDPALLARYSRCRAADHQRVVAFTDLLARLLGPNAGPLQALALRGGLRLLAAAAPLRSTLAAIGTGDLAAPGRLGRALPL